MNQPMSPGNSPDYGMLIPGYRLTEQLHEGHKTLVYRGLDENQTPVIIKRLRHPFPSLAERVQFRNQYTIAQALNLPTVVKSLALVPCQNGYALVMEDFGGVSLGQVLRQQGAWGQSAQGVKQFLSVAIQITEALADLAQHRVIHKDLKPDNILINPETQQVKLIDFCLASLLPHETQTLKSPDALEGTLAYLSPEQTGRMNRGIDYRSDFYALGVTFYELLSGQRPFQSEDPLELVYCHLAKEPVPLDQFRIQESGARSQESAPPLPPSPHLPIPKILSDIVLKLMAKNAEDRYQSALGLKADLETCLAQYTATQTIAEFPLGQVDDMARFNIPQRLYGREAQVETLLEVFERVSQGSCELVLVTGYSGVGKTALVNEIVKQLTRRKGYFAAGKFDQFQRGVPLSAPLQALGKLVHQLLTESDERLSYWRDRFLQKLGANAQLMIEAVPELELIIGPQPPVPELGPRETANRLGQVFNQFVQVFQSPDHPHITLVDDSQWADSASIDSLQNFLLNTENQYCLIIAAYRDNEVSPIHPLMQAFEALRQAGVAITEINLEPLALDHVTQLVADTLHTAAAVVVPLAELLFKKTAGNPFFLTQLFKTLHEDGLIWFEQNAPQPPNMGEQERQSLSEQKDLGRVSPDPAQSQPLRGGWQWDLAAIQDRDITDNVVELMIGKIGKLSAATQQILQLAACIGHQFDLQTLATVSEQSLSQTAEELWEAIQAGLMVPLGQWSSGLQGINTDEIQTILAQGQPIAYQFLHDRIQQAAYALIPEDQKQATHWQVGQLLRQGLSPQERRDQIFEIVNHLNLGRGTLSDPEPSPGQSQQLAQLNLEAGQKAKLSAAHQAALNYYGIGLDLLPPQAWHTDYALTYALHRHASEVAYLCGDFDQAERLYGIALSQAQTPLDKAVIYRVQVTQYQLQGRNAEAIALQRQSLQLLGWTVPVDPDNIQASLDEQIAIVNQFLEQHPVASILDLPPMDDETLAEILRILHMLLYAAWLGGDTTLALLAVAKMTTLSLQHGNSEMSPFGYVGYGMVAISLKKAALAYEFGAMAVQLCEQFDNADVRGMTNFLFAADVHSWSQPLRAADTYYENAFRYGMEAGNWVTASFMIIQSGSDRLTYGKTLNDLFGIVQTHADFLRQVKSLDNLDILTAGVLQPIRQLLGLTPSLDSFDGNGFSEADYLQKYKDDPYPLAWLYAVKIRHGYLFNQLATYPDLLSHLELVETALATHGKIPSTVFYAILIGLALIESASDVKEQQSHWQAILPLEDRLKGWQRDCPENIRHKCLLVEAEKARLNGQNLAAMDWYDQSINQAQAQGYGYEAALANELAARFYLNWGKAKIAAAYLQEAYEGYAQWGAKAKTADLATRYPELLAPILQAGTFGDGVGLDQATGAPGELFQSKTSSSSSTAVLDLATILKASQTISQEIQVDRLLTTLMQVVMENAGAQTGILMLKTGDDWQMAIHCQNIQACQDSQTCSDNQPCQLKTLTVDDSQPVPLTVIHYIQRTQETVVIEDVATAHAFATDPYWQRVTPQSILAVPILNQGHLIGILYLENSLTAGAFGGDSSGETLGERQELVQLIATQAAISLENARLYSTLEQKVAERTQALSQALTDLQATQTELIQSEKMAALGQLTASVGHEINTPLGVIRGATDNMMAAFQTTLRQLPTFLQRLSAQQQNDFLGLVDLALQNQSASWSTREERQRRRQLHEELVAQGVAQADRLAHQLTRLRLDLDSLPDLALLTAPSGPEILEMVCNLVLQQQGASRIHQEVDRAAKIVFALKTYSHRSDSLDQSPIQITDGLEIALTLYQNRLKQGIQVVHQYPPEISYILGNPDELTQVWVNLIDNAIYAMGQQGTLTITILTQADHLTVEITDSGRGIPPEAQTRIFDPFFTTKPRGEGSGLGLNIVQQIIQKHGGEIQVKSQPGCTTFTLRFPLGIAEWGEV